MLNELFCAFDKLAEQHGLEKIKTIGDAYMVVAGIPQPVADHAVAIAHMALDMIKARRGLLAAHGDEPVDPRRDPHRLGRRRRDRHEEVHLRPVGRHGEHGEPHGVDRRARADPGHARRPTALLHDQFELEERGPIEVKGKGAMSVYLLVRQREDPERVSIGVIGR